MEAVVQWATILSPIIAVVIAAWMNYTSTKDTRKQMEGLKRLCMMQMSNTLDMLEMELYKLSLGKEDNKSELKALHNELTYLRQERKPKPKDLDKVQHQIEKLNMDVKYKDTFAFKIMMRQFELLRGIDNVKGEVSYD